MIKKHVQANQYDRISQYSMCKKGDYRKLINMMIIVFSFIYGHTIVSRMYITNVTKILCALKNDETGTIVLKYLFWER